MTYDKKNYIQLSGELFNEVQSQRIFVDSKTFVDSIPKKKPEDILKEFLSNRANLNFNLKTFVGDNFFLPEEEEVNLNLPSSRNMEEHISLLWDYLIRKRKSYQNYSTLIPLKEDYIIPGGRFREVYYWDTYFTMLGLYACKRFELIKKMMGNFSYLIENFGFIPNGNRVYYLSRSQPPFFSLMINLVLKIGKEIKSDLPFIYLLEKEYNYWMKSGEDEPGTNSAYLHTVKYKEGLLNRYFDTEILPREESFYEDTGILENSKGISKGNFFGSIRAAAESGWDFSSRWFEDEVNLSTVIGAEIIPVDLNCLLAYSEKLLADLFEKTGDKFKCELFKEKFEARLKYIRTLFWNEKEGFFFDYNFKTNKIRKTYSLAGMFPLFFGFAEKHQALKAAAKLEKIFLKKGGLLTTPNYTYQQWDAPNGWPPLQWISIIGLRNYDFNPLADRIKSAWLNLNESVFKKTGKMFEKYNVVNTSLKGGGGEYPLQDGFGWTNGVAIALLKNLDYEFTTGII